MLSLSIVFSPSAFEKYSTVLYELLSQMIQQLYNYADDNGGALKVPTYFILDEFANIGKIPENIQLFYMSYFLKINVYHSYLLLFHMIFHILPLIGLNSVVLH